MRILLGLAIVLAARAAPAHALCIQSGLAPEVLTTRDTTLPPDGGVLVGWTSKSGVQEDPNDPSNQPTWTATDGKQAIALKRVSLAPGLSVYLAAGAGPMILKPKKGPPLGTFKRDPKLAKSTLGAPRPKTLTLASEEIRRGRRTRAVAELLAAPPSLAMAVIVYRVVGDTPTALSFARLPDTHDTLTALDVFEDAGRCTGLPAGSVPPNAGDRIALAWVDAFGRVSPLSAVITAKEGARW